MTEIQAPELGMTDEEAWLAETTYMAVQNFTNSADRSLQSADYRIGISDLGYCSERSRRMLDRQIPEPIDMTPAAWGHAIGAYVEEALTRRFPDAVTQATVTVVLHGDGGDYEISGHPDVILPTEGIVIDGKTARGLNTVRRTGPSQQQQFQRHLYAKGAHEAGYFGDLPLEQVRVANVWFDRAADERTAHCQMELFDQRVVDEATLWVDELVWAYTNGSEARKEPAREVCFATCGFATECRGLDSDVEGLLTDDTVLTAVDLYKEAAALEKRARGMKDEAKANLAGISGSTGEFAVRWIHVNGAHIEYDRAPSDRLDIRRVK